MHWRAWLILLVLLIPAGCGYGGGVASTPPPTLVLPPLTAMPTLTPLPTPTIRPPTTAVPTVIYTPEPGMYEAAISAFFRDGQAQRLAQPDVLQHKVAYIQPVFYETGAPVPQDVMDLIAAELPALGLTRVTEDPPDGVRITITPVKSDPEGTLLVYGKVGPTIALVFGINNVPCGGFVSVSYLLTRTDSGWQADQYQIGVC